MDIIETKILIKYLENILSMNDNWDTDKKIKKNIKQKYLTLPHYDSYYNDNILLKNGSRTIKLPKLKKPIIMA